MAQRETSAEIDEAAADWAVRVEHAPLAPAEQARFEAWLAADSRRAGAYARALAVFLHAKRAKALGAGFDPEVFLAAQADDAVVSVGHRPSRRRFLWLGGSAAAASVLVAVGLSPRAGAQTFRTPRGEVRLVPLPDGSSMTLNTASEVCVTFDEKRRAITLVEGEVLFDVAKDPARPFVVTAGATEICATGTSFVVRRLATAPVEVTVRQGEVEILGADMPVRKVGANMHAVAAAHAGVQATQMRSSDLARSLAWREGMLSFEDVPLQQAAQEFARYSDIQIRIADPAVTNETVTGLFAANNPVGFAKAVANTLGLKATVGRSGVTLHR